MKNTLYPEMKIVFDQLDIDRHATHNESPKLVCRYHINPNDFHIKAENGVVTEMKRKRKGIYRGKYYSRGVYKTTF